MNRRKCKVCTDNVHGASYAKHMRIKIHLESVKQNESIIPEWLFQEPIEKNTKKLHNAKQLKQIARDYVKLDDKHLNKEIAKKMKNQYYFTD